MRVSLDLTSSEGMNQAFEEFRKTGSKELRNQIVDAQFKLVRYLAGKFANRGVPIEDLIQVGQIGLINAVDRFELDKGTKFSTFATPTIVGEIRRHFRDKAWTLKVPRRLQELNLAASRAKERLRQSLGVEDPPVEAIADEIGITVDETLEAIELGNAYDTVSLDTKMSHGDDGPVTLAEFLGGLDAGLSGIENNNALFEAIEHLEPKLRAIIRLRFFEEKSQTEVAERLNISQMHVSRLQFKALKQLRILLTEGYIVPTGVESRNTGKKRKKTVLKEPKGERGMGAPENFENDALTAALEGRKALSEPIGVRIPLVDPRTVQVAIAFWALTKNEWGEIQVSMKGLAAQLGMTPANVGNSFTWLKNANVVLAGQKQMMYRRGDCCLIAIRASRSWHVGNGKVRCKITNLNTGETCEQECEESLIYDVVHRSSSKKEVVSKLQSLSSAKPQDGGVVSEPRGAKVSMKTFEGKVRIGPRSLELILPMWHFMSEPRKFDLKTAGEKVGMSIDQVKVILRQLNQRGIIQFDGKKLSRGDKVDVIIYSTKSEFDPIWGIALRHAQEININGIASIYASNGGDIVKPIDEDDTALAHRKPTQYQGSEPPIEEMGEPQPPTEQVIEKPTTQQGETHTPLELLTAREVLGLEEAEIDPLDELIRDAEIQNDVARDRVGSITRQLEEAKFDLEKSSDFLAHLKDAKAARNRTIATGTS